ncbi:MAG: hypothetical protein A3E61_02620 [Candidatus Colwellbacteria bacterium RIFCSPHIGHO2_12_FULL_43_12]|uniref:DUF192 domain-containing protein n=3 Tax=Candidatus Colwelliibacteriota TaxID=1817904 RepID=A0A1G1YZR8_9BACT|nr:MAG: hypothetical protein A3D47_01425 [Candidatus Colwellbacteria bacterium RIFCSPHIGHO2_02_FULL_43_15]OGY58763.1 MAG: hypothetical protein A3E61_02620 [Candidatus Colwellbacteria bacterium RIFCSPHIGHO2_12_FULL_43_12]OGY61442.1 MAG: hypothetical protein A3F99_00380 [Candidatus Colwellbacteria bacterium RIFCSPLOWO2_12_FULL_43_11]
MIKWLTIAFMVVGTIYYAVITFAPFGISHNIAIIDGNEFSVQIADSIDERDKGLSGRNSLGGKEGLLFVFDESDEYGFWMKDMKFPIDIIWIENNEVVYVLPNVKPDSYPSVFYPPQPANKVLEINAGLSESLGIMKYSSFLLK